METIKTEVEQPRADAFWARLASGNVVGERGLTLAQFNGGHAADVTYVGAEECPTDLRAHLMAYNPWKEALIVVYDDDEPHKVGILQLETNVFTWKDDCRKEPSCGRPSTQGAQPRKAATAKIAASADR